MLQPDLSVKRLLSVQGKVWGRLWNFSVVVWGKVERGERSGMSKAGKV